MNAAITPQSIEGVADIASVMRRMATPVPEWRKLFRSLGEMEQGEMEYLIDGFLPEGITFLGGLSGVGKTWFALSIAKALATGQPFLDKFAVPATCKFFCGAKRNAKRFG